MDKQDEMLKLVLSDEYFCKLYSINSDDYKTLDSALNSNIPALKVLATIIRDVNDNSKSTKKEVYLKTTNYLNEYYATKEN